MTISIPHPEGQIEVPAEAVVTLLEPLLGFPNRRDYALLPASRDGIWWFVSTSEPVATFVLADPFVAIPEYSFELSTEDQARLGIEQETDALLLVLLQIPLATEGTVTANARAPIVCNLRTRVAAQIISDLDRHALSHPVELTRYPLRAAESLNG